MKSIQEIAEETRELLYNLRTGATRIDKGDCSETLWELRGYLADNDTRERLDSIVWDIAHDPREPLEDINESFEPTTQNNTCTLWKWFILDMSHVRLVEEAIREYHEVNPAKNHALDDSIARALLKKEFEIFWAAKAYIMEVYEDQPKDDEDEDYDDEK